VWLDVSSINRGDNSCSTLVKRTCNFISIGQTSDQYKEISTQCYTQPMQSTQPTTTNKRVIIGIDSDSILQYNKSCIILTLTICSLSTRFDFNAKTENCIPERYSKEVLGIDLFYLYLFILYVVKRSKSEIV